MVVEMTHDRDGCWSVYVNGNRYIDRESYAVASGIADALRGNAGVAEELVEVANQIRNVETRAHAAQAQPIVEQRAPLLTLTRLDIILTACDLREVASARAAEYPDYAEEVRARADKFSALHAAMLAAGLEQVEVRLA